MSAAIRTRHLHSHDRRRRPPRSRAAAAALSLAADRPWTQISLRDIALKAEVLFAELYARADGKGAVLNHLEARFDRAALATASAEDASTHDRLFDAAMARIEAMEPHRAAR